MTVELLKDLDRDGGWTLLVDGVEQSYVDVDDPTHLEFEYMQHAALVIDAVFAVDRPLAAVHLGGGALTMARWLAATRPGSQQVVIESSAAVLATIRPLGDVAGCVVRHEDALEALPTLPTGAADLLVWDIYDGPRAHVATLDLAAIRQMRRVLCPGGIALLNVSDMVPFTVVRPVLAALGVAFDDVALLAEPSTLRGRRSGNCVLVGSRGALPAEVVRRRAAGAATRARVIIGDDVAALVGSAVPATDAAPLPGPDEATGRAFL